MKATIRAVMFNNSTDQGSFHGSKQHTDIWLQACTYLDIADASASLTILCSHLVTGPAEWSGWNVSLAIAF